MLDRKLERGIDKVTANLRRVNLENSQNDKQNLFKISTKIPKILNPAFKDHKAVLNVDDMDTLSQLVSVLNLGEPRWVGVDLEHSKRHAYHGMICMI